MISADALQDFIVDHALPEAYAEDARRFFLPLAIRLAESCPPASIIGVGGPQGTGKSTVARLLSMALNDGGRRAVCLSLDDFYLPRAERMRRAADDHPLFACRGVPGTHDIEALGNACSALLAPGPERQLALPVFDKALDDRAASTRRVSRPTDLVIVEGWCVGVPPQTDDELAEPVNELERVQDKQCVWRRMVNGQLAVDYAAFYSRMTRLIWLQPPDFEAIVRWRQEQERKLGEAVRGRRREGVMDDRGVRRFIDHFERLTRHGIRAMPRIADVIVRLDSRHRCAAVQHRSRDPS